MVDILLDIVYGPILPMVIYGIFSIAVLVVFYFVLRFLTRKMVTAAESFKKVILLVTVPKERQADKNITDQEEKEEIGQAKAFFSVLGGLHVDKGFASKFYGRHDHFPLKWL